MNPSIRLSSQQKSLLHKLLDRHENASPGRAVALRVVAERFPDYFDDANPDRVRSWEEEVRQLAAQGWLRVETGRGAEAHRIVRLVLARETAPQIAAALGRMTEAGFLARASRLVEEARSAVSGEPDFPFRDSWLAFLERERERWSSARVSVDSRESVLAETALLYRAAYALLRRRADAEPISWRQFSVRQFGDSKALDRLRRQVAALLYRVAVAQDLDCDELADEGLESIFSDFGILSKERVLCVAGPIRLLTRDGTLLTDGALWRPFLVVPESVLESAAIDPGSARNVLTVENEESFQVLCRQGARPGWVFLYLGGFPSSDKIRLLKRLAEAGLALFHWGDLDCGGVGIFRVLETKLGRSITPLAMGPEWLLAREAECRPLSEIELGRLRGWSEQLGPSHPLAPTIGAMIRLRRKLEQEAVSDPFARPL